MMSYFFKEIIFLSSTSHIYALNKLKIPFHTVRLKALEALLTDVS